MNDMIDLPKGGDDAINAGLTIRESTLTEEIESRKEAAQVSGDDDANRSQFHKLFEATEHLHFFVCDGEPYMSPGDSVAIPLESRKAEQLIRLSFFERFDVAASADNLRKFIDIKSAQLSVNGETAPVFRRVGRLGNSYFLDLCHDGKVVEITTNGWRVVKNPEGVYFVRSGSAEEALPTPTPGGDVMALQLVANVSPEMLKLLLVYLVCALRPGFPFVVLVIEGEAGSGKSTLARILKYLIDPSRELIRAMPATERDFAVFAHNSHLLVIDNVDRVTPNQSDMLCRAATGGGFSARTHYSMTDETVISIQRPVIITGIDGVVERADMADRVALLQLERVSDESRRTEADLWPVVENIRADVLGGLLDAMVAGLANLHDLALDKLPRMADFARFATAAEAGLPWSQGEALSAYYATRDRLFEQAFEKDRVAVSILRFLTRQAEYGEFEWEGTVAELLERLEPPFGGEDRWPTKPSTLGIRITKALPLLRAKGVTFSKKKSGSSRYLCFLFSKNLSHPSHLSQSTANTGLDVGQVEF